MLEKQERAVKELTHISLTSKNRIEIVSPPVYDEKSKILQIDISIDCSEFVKRGPKSLPLLKRERLVLLLDSVYPLSLPHVYSLNLGFMISAHVQWLQEFEVDGKILPKICLYQSPSNDWEPNEGMFGLMKRLVKWLERGAASELDLPGDPLHAPLAYYSEKNPIRIILSKDAPKPDGKPWIGFFKFKTIRENVYEVLDFIQNPYQPTDLNCGVALLLPKETFFEYPKKLDNLFNEIKTCGGITESTVTANIAKIAKLSNGKSPLFVMVGSPMRGISGSQDRKYHLAVGDIGSLETVFAKDEIRWCKSYENRPEIIVRRDGDSSISVFRNKRVLLIGVGGLGSYTAEALVRAGVQKMTVVDSGDVHPGLLVRQNYTQEDIGKPKAQAIVDRLSKLNLNCQLTPMNIDFLNGLGFFVFEDFDLIINLSASNPVGLFFEGLSTKKVNLPVVASGMTSSDSKAFLGTIYNQNYVGGPKQLIRDFHIRMQSNPNLEKVITSFWPKDELEKIFQPEPGCSEPTFIGSAADMQFFSSFFINRISAYLTTPKDEEGILFGMFRSTDEGINTWEYSPNRYKQFESKEKKANIRLSAKALAQLKCHIEEAKNSRGASCETGGLMFGCFENAIDLIVVDECTDAPKDSEFSPRGFTCGTNGVEELTKKISAATDNQSHFVGYWHTHPKGPTNPSWTDLIAAFTTVSTLGENLRQVLFMIINPENFTFDFYYFDHITTSEKGILIVIH